MTNTNYHLSLLARLIAVHLVLFGAAAVSAAWAEDAASGSNHSDALTPGPRAGQGQGQSDEGGAALGARASGKSNSGAVGDAETSGREKAKVEPNATGKVDSIGNMGQHHAVSKGGSNRQEQTDGKGIRHGEDFAGAKRSGTEFSPIDTRITVLGASSRFGRAPKALDWKKQEIAPQSGKSADHRRTSAPPTKDSLVRNAVGLRVDQTSTGNKRTDVKVFERPAVETTPRSTSRAGTGGVGAVSPDVPRRGLVPLAAGGGKPQQPPINTAMNPSIIDGRDMARLGSRSSVIGGAPKNLAGGINGTSFRPRHP
jgi:hypothetical protein